MEDSHDSICCYMLFSESKDINFKFKDRDEVVSAGDIILTSDTHRNFFSKDEVIEFPLSQRIVHEMISFLSKENLHPLVHNKIPEFFTAKCSSKYFFRRTSHLYNKGVNTKNEHAKLVTHALMLLSEFFHHAHLLSFLIQTVRSITTTKVTAIIQSDLARNWRLDDLASELCISASCLKRKLRDEGTCYKEIITDCRMQLATVLLKGSNVSMYDIAVKCGFSSTSYFISVFRKYFSTTPLNYSKEIFYRGF